MKKIIAALMTFAFIGVLQAGMVSPQSAEASDQTYNIDNEAGFHSFDYDTSETIFEHAYFTFTIDKSSSRYVYFSTRSRNDAFFFIKLTDADGNEISGLPGYLKGQVISTKKLKFNPGTYTIEVLRLNNSSSLMFDTVYVACDKALEDATVKVNKSVVAFKGKNKDVYPTLSVSYGGKTLRKGTDYRISSNSYSVGKATYTVSGLDNYAGSKTGTYIIAPQKEKVRKLKGLKKGLTFNWKNNTWVQNKYAKKFKYQIQVSTKKSFKKAKKYKSSFKYSGYTVNGLKAKKKYFVRVRGTVKIDGKTYYGEWSPVKSVKTKK